ncbi:MAG: hypothetical protein AAGG07_02130 [Planctomycetota bacterium]
MTSEQHMLAVLRRLPLLACLLLATGCASSTDGLRQPQTYTAPYDTSEGNLLWAVVPLRNDSGLSPADTQRVSDEVIASLQSVRGVTCLPLNRTLDAMRALGMNSLDDPEDAKALAREMKVDAIVVGSVTAWDPYTPVIGVSLALYALPGPMFIEARESLDTRWLTYQPTDYQYFPGSGYATGPASVTSRHLDASDHDTLRRVRLYAEGRTEPGAPFGWRRYTASMPLFTKFAAHDAVGQLMDHEWIRLARDASRETARAR